MNEWFKRVAARIKELWSKWSPLQKGILIGVIVVAVVLLILLLSLNASPATVPIINRAITDQAQLQRITNRLDQEGIVYSVSADGMLTAPNRERALEARAIIVREDLLPSNTDPWNLFDIERWTITDFERNINLRRAITAQVEQHIESLADIDNATVSLVLPERATFSEDQAPTTASITIIPKVGSNIREDRKAIEGLVKLVQFAIEGLQRENITITDQTGRILNNFDDMAAFDDLELRKRELALKRQLEAEYTNLIKSRLATIVTPGRIEVPKVEIDLDMGKWTAEKEEFAPITVRADNPNTPFDETETVLSIERSRSNFEENYTGTAFVPQGPPGQEPNIPPAYQDLSTLGGNYTRTDSVINSEINSTRTTQTGSPTIKKISVSVVIDGRWRRVFDDTGNPIVNIDGSLERRYEPVSPEDLQKAQRLVEAAVGYNRGRGDTVVVENIAFDRTAEHAAEDLEFQQQRDVQRILLGVMISLAGILAIFIIFRLITREIERRRRLREEELARQHQAMREAALRSAEEESAEVEMSVEERARLEMQENAINIAREHPEDVAQLIRTWLLEE